MKDELGGLAEQGKLRVLLRLTIMQSSAAYASKSAEAYKDL